jgi:hypothetical protein
VSCRYIHSNWNDRGRGKRGTPERSLGHIDKLSEKRVKSASLRSLFCFPLNKFVRLSPHVLPTMRPCNSLLVTGRWLPRLFPYTSAFTPLPLPLPLCRNLRTRFSSSRTSLKFPITAPLPRHHTTYSAIAMAPFLDSPVDHDQSTEIPADDMPSFAFAFEYDPSLSLSSHYPSALRPLTIFCLQY